MHYRIGIAIGIAAALAFGWQARGAQGVSDPYLWLEDVHGEKPIAWVKQENAKTLGVLTADPDYHADFNAVLSVLDAQDRIPFGDLDHEYVFNFWQDARHPKGIWRRTTIADYANAAPHWETLLDIDRLAAGEHENWVFKGTDCARSLTRCLVSLSRGGGDAVVMREFDLATRSFIKSGFTLPEAKSTAAYVDDDTILFATNFGSGSLTTSGYPRIVKIWKRGAAITSARTVFEGKAADVSVDPRRFPRQGRRAAAGVARHELLRSGIFPGQSGRHDAENPVAAIGRAAGRERWQVDRHAARGMDAGRCARLVPQGRADRISDSQLRGSSPAAQGAIAVCARRARGNRAGVGRPRRGLCGDHRKRQRRGTRLSPRFREKYVEQQ